MDTAKAAGAAAPLRHSSAGSPRSTGTGVLKAALKFRFFAVLRGMHRRRQPAGRPTIAQRFIAGTEHRRRRPSPVRDDRSSGRATPPATAFFRPSGTQSGTAAQSSDESLGYFQWSMTGPRDVLLVSHTSTDSTLNSEEAKFQISNFRSQISDLKSLLSTFRFLLLPFNLSPVGWFTAPGYAGGTVTLWSGGSHGPHRAPGKPVVPGIRRIQV